MEMILKDELTKLSQYGGKPAFSAELKEHKEYKHTQNVDTPWIQIRKDGTCYVNLFDANLVPTKSDVASVDEIRKWGESSLEEKEKIVDGVLKALKIRRLNRECTRKGRKEKRYKKTTKKKSVSVCLLLDTYLLVLLFHVKFLHNVCSPLSIGCCCCCFYCTRCGCW
jgi:hypothetical protein